MQYFRGVFLGVVGVVCLTSAAAAVPPETLSLRDLVNHPDRWPATITLQKDYQFRNGAVLHAGDKARVVNFDGSQVALVDADGKPYHDDHLGDKRIFALYFGANWCAPCHAFSPDFVKFLNDAMPRHPELAVVLMSNDQQPDQMLAYMNPHGRQCDPTCGDARLQHRRHARHVKTGAGSELRLVLSEYRRPRPAVTLHGRNRTP